MQYLDDEPPPPPPVPAPEDDPDYKDCKKNSPSDRRSTPGRKTFSNR